MICTISWSLSHVWVRHVFGELIQQSQLSQNGLRTGHEVHLVDSYGSWMLSHGKLPRLGFGLPGQNPQLRSSVSLIKKDHLRRTLHGDWWPIWSSNTLTMSHLKFGSKLDTSGARTGTWMCPGCVLKKLCNVLEHNPDMVHIFEDCIDLRTNTFGTSLKRMERTMNPSLGALHLCLQIAHLTDSFLPGQKLFGESVLHTTHPIPICLNVFQYRTPDRHSYHTQVWTVNSEDWISHWWRDMNISRMTSFLQQLKSKKDVASVIWKEDRTQRWHRAAKNCLERSVQMISTWPHWSCCNMVLRSSLTAGFLWNSTDLDVDCDFSIQTMLHTSLSLGPSGNFELQTEFYQWFLK